MSDSDDSSSSSESEEPQPTTKKGKAKAKAEDKGPKKPLSAYMFFCKARRSVLKQENPESSFCDLGKKLGQEWKQMDPEARTEYTEQADKDKLRYAAEGGGAKGRKRKKKVGGPKRNLSAYMFFSRDTRPIIKTESPNMGFADLGKEIGKRWKLQEDKSKFHAMAAEDKIRYRTEMDAYQEEEKAAPKKQKIEAPAPSPVDGDDDDDDDGNDGNSGTSSDSDSGSESN